MASYDKGDLIRCTGTFTNAAGTETDPDDVFFKVRDPYRNIIVEYEYGVDAEVIKSSTGIYYSDVSGDVVGKYFYTYYSTGAGQAAGENDFNIKESEF